MVPWHATYRQVSYRQNGAPLLAYLSIGRITHTSVSPNWTAASGRFHLGEMLYCLAKAVAVTLPLGKSPFGLTIYSR